MSDDGEPIAYSALGKGVPVLSSSGRQFAVVDHVLEIPEEDVFCGIAIATEAGIRFVERDLVDRITTTAVHCAIDDSQTAALPPPPEPGVNVRASDLPDTRPRGTTIVRCSRGGLFETVWIPLMSFKAVRLGNRRLQRCPVHGRWELIERVDPSTLTEAQLAEAARYPVSPIP